MKDKTYDGYSRQVSKVLNDKFKDLSENEKANLPVEKIKTYTRINDDFKDGSIRIKDAIQKEYIKKQRNNRKSKTAKSKRVELLKQELSNYDVKKDVIIPIKKLEISAEKINDFCSNDKISISLIQRKFFISYPSGARIIDGLLEQNIILKQNVGYKVLDKDNLKQFLITEFNVI